LSAHSVILQTVYGALLLVTTVAVSQNCQATEFDFKAAEKQLEDSNPVVHASLHEAGRAPDGTREIGLGKPTIQRVGLPDPLPPPFKTEREWETYYQYCGPDAIVRATHIDSRPVLTSDKKLVYTVSHFLVVDTIKSDVSFTPGERIAAYRVGGEIEDGGERLRVDTPDSAAFEPGKSYILLLRRDKNALAQQYSMDLSQTIAIRNEDVYPVSGRFAWLSGMDAFPAGSTYASLRNVFIKVHSLKACPDAR
jgi:hypothetical protein